ncbi:MAG: peptidoglycan DD-metalloendopeptidase family protein [Heteroscytonema crispum UTEX LB 1556]
MVDNTPSEDALVDQQNAINPRVNRRVGTQAAMIGLAISMGATSLLVTRQSDQAQAAEPVGSQKAATNPASDDTEVKFAPTNKLESQAVSPASVPESPAIVEPTAISQLPGLGAKWQVAANGMSVTTTTDKNSFYAKTQLGQKLKAANANVQTANKQLETVEKLSSASGVAGNQTTSFTVVPQTVASSDTASSEVDAQLKAQQEFALNRLQEKSNRLRESLAELRSGETKGLSQVSQASTALSQRVAVSTATPQLTTTNNASQANLVSRLKQASEAQVPAPMPSKTAATQATVAPSAQTAYEVKPGDTLAAIALNYGTSVSDLIKANNLSNPNQLQISQKLSVPGTVNRNIASQTTVAMNAGEVESSITSKVATQSINATGANPNTTVAATSQLNATIVAPTTESASAWANFTANAIAPVTVPTPIAGYGMGGDTPIPKAFADMQLAKRPDAPVRTKQNQRLRSLQDEIERLREKYRAQQSGNVVVPVEPQANNIPVSIPALRPNNVAVPVPVYRPTNTAVPIAVPRPMVPSYSAQPVKPEFGATRQVNQPINPEWSAPGNRPSVRVATPPTGVDASASLGDMRGRQVSPDLPPLAAVDRYLPRAVDENTPPAFNPSDPSNSITAFIWPAKGTLTSGYGWRWGRMHRGIDVANSTGTPVYASADGVIQRAGWNNGGYGNLVEIRHADGSMTRYGHNSRIMVQVGQQVRQGETIALMGSTGFSTGPHSHFEIHPSGKGAVNPIAFLPPRL